MYLAREEKPTNELRFNTMNRRTSPVLEQKWQCRDMNRYWHEWRPVPSVEAPIGETIEEKTFANFRCD